MAGSTLTHRLAAALKALTLLAAALAFPAHGALAQVVAPTVPPAPLQGGVSINAGSSLNKQGPESCFDGAWREAQDAMQAPGLADGPGWSQGDGCPTGTPQLQQCWDSLKPARQLIERAGQLFDQASHAAGQAAGQMLQQSKALLDQAKGDLGQAQKCYGPITPQNVDGPGTLPQPGPTDADNGGGCPVSICGGNTADLGKGSLPPYPQYGGPGSPPGYPPAGSGLTPVNGYPPAGSSSGPTGYPPITRPGGGRYVSSAAGTPPQGGDKGQDPDKGGGKGGKPPGQPGPTGGKPGGKPGPGKPGDKGKPPVRPGPTGGKPGDKGPPERPGPTGGKPGGKPGDKGGKGGGTTSGDGGHNIPPGLGAGPGGGTPTPTPGGDHAPAPGFGAGP